MKTACNPISPVLFPVNTVYTHLTLLIKLQKS